MVNLKQLMKNTIFQLKCAQMGMTILSLSALESLVGISDTNRMLMYAVTIGFALIILWQIADLFTGRKRTKKLALFLATGGGITWLYMGSTMLQTYRNFFPYEKYLEGAAEFIPGGKFLSAGVMYAVERIKDKFYLAAVFTLLNGLTFFYEAWVVKFSR